MEPLWSPVVATGAIGGNSAESEAAKSSENRCHQCHWLPGAAHGKEGVDRAVMTFAPLAHGLAHVE